MAKTEQSAHRTAVHEARDRAREAASALARQQRRKLSIFLGLGLSFVLLGGFTGSYIALDEAAAGAAGSSVAIALAEPAAEPGPVRGATVRLALTEPSGLRIALPPLDPILASLAPPDVSAAGSETQRLVLGAALDELSESAGDSLPPEIREAALARLDEAPLETAAGAEIQRVALPMTELPELPEPPGLDAIAEPAWQRFAVPVATPGARPMIAVVLDDLGLNRSGTNRAIELPGPLTLAFMTYAEGLPRMTARARRAGHELMLHLPMAPRDPAFDPGPNVLRAELAPAELARRLDWGLDRFEGFVGVNNHMGSRFTASREAMTPVMAALRARGLLFLDSMTSGASVGGDMARRAGVPYATRDVFLDNESSDRAAIARQFARLEAVARRRGSAIGIGHPHRATLDVLARWLSEARARGFDIVPVSAIVRHRMGLGARYVEASG